MQADFRLAADDWATLRRLLDEALALPAAARAAWLEALDAPHAAFEPRLRALLAHASDATLLQTLPKLGAPPLDEDLQQLGPYRLLQCIGEGGMASVWLAERVDMLRGRRVALKLPHGAWRGEGWAARLAREREILSTLAHPNIAAIYDAGVGDNGQPYLALEYVEGRPIDAHCDERGVTLPQRLRLFLQVARAVAHAHAKLVVHRDLKPSNILVTAQGQVRLLDFGIAKLLEPDPATQPPLTQQGAPLLTPEYASPEQVAGEPIGTASDIYSLGVVLYELLTGQRPSKPTRQSRAALEEAILYAEPARPSDVAPGRPHRRALRGDLDAIVLKALKKRPEQRYGTVEALADDLERHLARRPVMAQPDSGAYRLGKFIARNRLAAGAGAAVLAAIALGGAVAVWQARTAWEEQRKAEEVKQFLASMLIGADPWEASAGVSSVADLLRHSKQQVETRLASRPSLQVELLNIVGMGLLHHQDAAGAEAALLRAAATADATLPRDHPQRLRTRIFMAELHLERSEPAPARSELTLAIPALRSGGDALAADLVTALWDLSAAEVHEGRFAEAVAAASEAQRHALSRLGEQHPLTAGVAVTAAVAHLYAGQPEQALDAARRGHRLTLALYGPDAKRPQTIEAHEVLGRALAAAGQFEPALAALQLALSQANELAGADSFIVGSIKFKLAAVQARHGQLRPALAHSEAGVQLVARHRGTGSIFHTRALSARGLVLQRARDPRAAGVLAEALAQQERALGADSPETLATRTRLALALAHGGRAAEAQATVEPSLARLRGSPHPAQAGLLHALAVAKRMSGDHGAALALQARALAAWGSDPAYAVERALAQADIGISQHAVGEHATAVASLQRALDALGPLQGGTAPDVADAIAALDEARRAAGTLHRTSGSAVPARP